MGSRFSRPSRGRLPAEAVLALTDFGSRPRFPGRRCRAQSLNLMDDSWRTISSDEVEKTGLHGDLHTLGIGCDRSAPRRAGKGLTRLQALADWSAFKSTTSASASPCRLRLSGCMLVFPWSPSRQKKAIDVATNGQHRAGLASLQRAAVHESESRRIGRETARMCGRSNRTATDV